MPDIEGRYYANPAYGRAVEGARKREAPGQDAKKLDPAVVLYMPPKVLNPHGYPKDEHAGACCGRCMMYVPDKKSCTIVYHDGDKKDSTVSAEHGVCGLYVGGMPMKGAAIMPTVPRSVAGYVEGPGVPTHCGNCKYFDGKAEACEIVAGHIEASGCSNAWEWNGKKER